MLQLMDLKEKHGLTLGLIKFGKKRYAIVLPVFGNHEVSKHSTLKAARTAMRNYFRSQSYQKSR